MTALQARIEHLRSLASCQRADVRYAISAATRRAARLALADTLRNLRILEHT